MSKKAPFGCQGIPKSVMYFPQNETGKGQYALNFNTLQQVRQQTYNSFELGTPARPCQKRGKCLAELWGFILSLRLAMTW